MKVVGLGKAGCQIAKVFSKFPPYEAYGIDVQKDADITIKKRKTHEEYEKHFPSLKKKLKFSGEDVLVVMGGSGTISGAALRLLEQLQSNQLTVLYIQPDLDLASETQKMQERIVKNVLQEYARSGMIECVILVDNLLIERGIGEVPIMGYFDVVNQALVNTLHMINVFKHTPPVIDTTSKLHELTRVGTFGTANLATGEEKKFFPLLAPTERVFYYAIPEEDIDGDPKLLSKIKKQIKV